jgi:hypothetical protein
MLAFVADERLLLAVDRLHLDIVDVAHT